MTSADKSQPGGHALPVDDTLLDVPTLKSLQKLDKNLLPKLVDSFGTDTRTTLVQLRDAVSSHDTKAIHQSAHTVTGVSGALGAVRLYELCKEVKIAADENQGVDFHQKLECIESTYELTLEAMHRFLSTQDNSR